LKIINKDSLAKNLIEHGYLKIPRIIEAFQKIDRGDFVLDEYKSEAYTDVPLPIGYGQTISQPSTVAFMLELLQPKPGDRILDIGFGSGWTTALLAHIVGEKGKVCAIERIPELYEFGKKNAAKYNFIEEGIVEMKCGDGAKEYEKGEPYDNCKAITASGNERFDKILAGASAKELPRAWKGQLKIGGRIVAPVGWSVWLFIKKGENEFEEKEYPGFSFVPLIGD
jgi:protein-L-isoaspartate(D-aspartate) O-methyltransferase